MHLTSHNNTQLPIFFKSTKNTATKTEEEKNESKKKKIFISIYYSLYFIDRIFI